MGFRSRQPCRIAPDEPVIDGLPWDEAVARCYAELGFLAQWKLNPRLWRRVSPSDMVQITVQEAHEKRFRFRGSSERELLAWLRAILLHRIIDKARQLRCGKSNIDLETAITDTIVRSTDSPSRHARNQERVRMLMSALEELPGNQRDAVVLFHLQQRELDEVAEIMGKAKGAVSNLLCRGLDRLFELLQERERA